MRPRLELLPAPLTFALALTLASSARAETPRPGSHTHDGFYLSLATGAGYVHADVSTTGSDLHDATSGTVGSSIETSIAAFASSGHLLLGGTPLPGFAVGGGHMGNILVSPSRSWNGHDASLHTFTFGVTGPFGDYYVDPHGGFHVIAMLGLSDVVVDASGSTTHGLFGFGGALGVGHDFWVSDNWSLGFLGRGMVGGVWWGAPAGVVASSPTNPDALGADLHESQLLFNLAFLLTATYH